MDNEPHITAPEGLEILDRIGPLKPEALPTSACMDALEASANIGGEQVGQIIRYESTHPTENTSEVPKTFTEMLRISGGNFAQRLTRAWITPKNPEGTIRLMRALQVHHFQQIPIKALDLIKKLAHIEVKAQTNYTLGDNSLNSLIDFATNKTTFNEISHLVQIPMTALMVLGGVANGHIDSTVAVGMGAFIVNTYSVLAQRYSRARLSIAIDKSLQRNKEFDREKYSNMLGIRLPEPSGKK